MRDLEHQLSLVDWQIWSATVAEAYRPDHPLRNRAYASRRFPTADPARLSICCGWEGTRIAAFIGYRAHPMAVADAAPRMGLLCSNLWIRPGSHPGWACRLLRHLLEQHSSILSVGFSEQGRRVFSLLGFQFCGRLQRRLLILPAWTGLATKGTKEEVTIRPEPDLAKDAVFGEPASGIIRSSDFLRERYLHDPFADYEILSLSPGSLFVIKHEIASGIRIGRVARVMECLIKCGDEDRALQFFQTYLTSLIKRQYLFIDFFGTCPASLRFFTRLGWADGDPSIPVRVQPVDSVTPNYEVAIWSDAKLSDTLMVTRGDGDLDRPTRLVSDI